MIVVVQIDDYFLVRHQTTKQKEVYHEGILVGIFFRAQSRK